MASEKYGPGSLYASSSSVFGLTDITKEQVGTISFYNSFIIKDTYNYSWDASFDSDSSIIGYAVLNLNTNLYDLDICLNNASVSKIFLPGTILGIFSNFLNLTNFYNIDNIIPSTYYFSGLFANCKKLKTLDLSGWNTSYYAYYLENMFANCESLTDLKLDGWNLSNYNYNNFSNNMFLGCTNLTNLSMSNWVFPKVINTCAMFKGLYKLTSLNLSNWNTSNVTDMSSMFYGCYNLNSLNLSNWNTNNVTNMSSMFSFCWNLNSLNLSDWNTSNVTNMMTMFYESTIKNLNVSNWDVSNVTSMKTMFGHDTHLVNLDISNWNVSNVSTMAYMFLNCSNLTNLNVSNWDTSNVIYMEEMFKGCSNLKNLDITGWNSNAVMDTSYMFAGCSNLKTIYVKPNGWNLNKDPYDEGDYMFLNCYNLIGRKGTTYVNSVINNSYARIDGGPDLPGYFCGAYNIAAGDKMLKDAYFRGQKVNKAILGRDLLNLKKKIITFTMDPAGSSTPLVSYQAEEGMTFEKWVNSDYCTDKEFYFEETGELKYSTTYVYYIGSDQYWHTVYKNDIIDPEKNYFAQK